MEVFRCIEELQVPFYHYDMVKRSFIILMETESSILSCVSQKPKSPRGPIVVQWVVKRMLTTPFSGRARGCDVYAWLEKMVGREYYLNLKITKYNVEDPTKPVTISMAWSDESNTRKNAKTTLSNEGSE